MKHFVVVLLSGFLLGGCSHGRKIVLEKAKVEKPGAVSVEAFWVKARKDRWDANLELRNLSKAGLIIFPKDFHCSRGATEGEVGNINQSIAMPSSSAKTIILRCFMSANIPGDFKIQVASVYGNPSGDGVSKGALLASRMEILVPEKAAP